jgi:transcriptional regulator with XRE-family HTH domain
MHQYMYYDAYMRQPNSFTSSSVRESLVDLGRRIRLARKARKLSLTDLENICRIHRTTLGRLERGEEGVSVGVFLTVLEALNELADIELLLSKPEMPKHLRSAPKPVLEQDF